MTTDVREKGYLPIARSGAISVPIAKPVVLVFMGVSGCGKTSVAAILAGRLGWPFEEGDALHPQSNVDKMKAGHPLTDDDRWPWLEKVAEWVEERLDSGQHGLITCSALKRSYRDIINRRGSGVVFVFLSGSRETIAARLAVRHGHFMPPSLLESQFADLEEPTSDEPEIRVDIGPAPGVIAQGIVDELGLSDSTDKGKRP
ncbi:MAG TPA: gluconokinase [Candidatus Acidoferrales bacterium]|nr:gluconokinase [Candidatus Acidoferrales bacterium]